MTMAGGRLALAKSISKGSVAQLDVPTGQYTMLVIELLALLGLVAINITALVTHVYGKKGALTAISGLVIWTYVLILVSLRLGSTNSRWRLHGLWNNTAVIYGCQWLCSVIIFRSAIIHPRSRFAQILTCVEFALISLLFGIAMTTRKGNKAVVLEWEAGIEPSREPLASLFSLATFGWVDAIVWQGYKKTFELADVWNLATKDKAAHVLASYRQLKKTTGLSWHLLKHFRILLVVQCLYAVVGGIFTFLPTLLLKAILEYIEDPESAPRNVVWL